MEIFDRLYRLGDAGFRAWFPPPAVGGSEVRGVMLLWMVAVGFGQETAEYAGILHDLALVDYRDGRLDKLPRGRSAARCRFGKRRSARATQRPRRL
jgi:hypothetical protein